MSNQSKVDLIHLCGLLPLSAPLSLNKLSRLKHCQETCTHKASLLVFQTLSPLSKQIFRRGSSLNHVLGFMAVKLAKKAYSSEHGAKGRYDRSGARLSVMNMPNVFKRFSIPFLRKVIGGTAILTLSACSTYRPNLAIDYLTPYRPAVVNPLLPDAAQDIASVGVLDGEEGPVAIFTQGLRELERPIEISFIDAPADAVLRRIAEYTNLTYVGAEKLYDNYVTLSVVLVTADDVYELLQTLAVGAGSELKLVGTTAHFVNSGSGSSPNQGYLILNDRLTPELVQLVHSVYGVNCASNVVREICFGTRADISRLSDFVNELGGVRPRLFYDVVRSDVDLEALAGLFGLEGLTISALSEGSYMVLTRDARTLELVRSINARASDGECSRVVHSVSYRTPAELAPLLGATCSPLVVVGNVMRFGSLDPNAQLLELVELDRPSDKARLSVFIVSDGSLNDFSLVLDGFDGRIPVDDFAESVRVNLVGNRGLDVTVLDLTTTGDASTSVSSTDRVEGDLLVTDGGSQVRAVDERTTGLTVTFSGVVTHSGYSGGASVVDSVLDGDITRSSSCDVRIDVDFGRVTKACDFVRNIVGEGFNLFGINKGRSSARYSVYVGVSSHQVAEYALVRSALEATQEKMDKYK